ncbi:hypothetical protein QDR54_17675 [Acinetobacter baumannii]|uniref:hypothetical protein n=4 Tax=Gammaproteobacteria TaxID=1236 RepID=UPI0023413634|nr:hypothetical protein [Acinetobacter baumannii]MDC4560040.1 hypothetical protein [Acinetobacter baumannii]MDC5611630.1 hypothetical protein [Acinetobacter baumannii]MDH2654708.1 hypothetical protein [Acinetobacter baumannii]
MATDLFAQRQLVVASLDPMTGNVDSSNIQLLSEWQRGERNTSLVNLVHGHTLFDILKDDLGLVRYDNTEHRYFPTFLTYNSEYDVERDCMQLLGKIAEALIVKACHRSVYENRNWARYARRGQRQVSQLDNFIAVGTGLHSTFNSVYVTKHNPNDTQRDILWVNKERINEQMMMINNQSKNSGNPAGLQIKVSRDGFNYVYRKDIARSKYEVPLVYFDLGNDFQDLANAIYRDDRNVDIGYDFIRGADINFDIHEQLYSYYFLLRSILKGIFPIQNLLNYDDILNVTTKLDLQEMSDSYVNILQV